MSAPVHGGARRYSELSTGDELCGALTVTEAHVVTAAGLFNDPGPNHVNELQARRNRFGRRIVHGPLVVGIADGVIGNALGGSIVALLEQTTRFRHPAHPGDTLIVRWTVQDKADRSTFDGGGVVTFDGEVLNQDGRVLVELRAVLAVGDRPPWSASEHLRDIHADRGDDHHDHANTGDPPR